MDALFFDGLRTRLAGPAVVLLGLVAFGAILSGPSEASASSVLVEQARMSTLTRAFDDGTGRVVEEVGNDFLLEFPFSNNTTSESISDRGGARATVRGAMGADRSASLTGTAFHDISMGTETNSGARATFSYAFHVETPSILTIRGSVFASAFDGRASISLDEFLDPGFNTIFEEQTLGTGIRRNVETQIFLDVNQDYVLRADVDLGSARGMRVDGDWRLSFDIAPVPEPGTALLLGLGLSALASGRPRSAAAGSAK